MILGLVHGNSWWIRYLKMSGVSTLWSGGLLTRPDEDLVYYLYQQSHLSPDMRTPLSSTLFH